MGNHEVCVQGKASKTSNKAVSEDPSREEGEGLNEMCSQQSMNNNNNNNMEGNQTTEEEAGAEEIQLLLEKLKLEEEKSFMEIEDDDLEETDRDFQSVIACKILTFRMINAKVFSVMMPEFGE